MSRRQLGFRQSVQSTRTHRIEERTMYRITTIIAAAALLAACSSSQPGEADIRQQFELTELPGLVELKSFTLEQQRNTGDDENPIWLARYTAKAAVREDTYELETVEGETRLLKPFRRAGEAFPLYGLVRSERAGDGWRHSFQRDGSSNPVLGRPRGDYGPDAPVAGSPEATALLAAIEQRRDQERIAAETARAAEVVERRRAEQAEAEKRRRIEEAVARHGAGFAPDSLYLIWPGDGKKRALLVTAKTEASTRNGAVYGTDRYGTASDFPRTVVHAGVLKPGETGIVEVTGINQSGLSQGSPRNGIDSIDTDRSNLYTIRLLERIDDVGATSD